MNQRKFTTIPLHQESYMIPIEQSNDVLHLKRLYSTTKGTPILMTHGAVENGSIFYSKSGKGLAPFLAKHGYDVYIGDLRGHGLSTPTAGKNSTYGLTEHIIGDINAFSNKIQELRGPLQQVWIGHSWGGVYQNANLIRFSENRSLVKAMVHLGAKRHVSIVNTARFIQLDFFWRFLARIVHFFFGYLPMKDLKLFLGSDNESSNSFLQSISWLTKKTWIDAGDNFNYHESLRDIILPPALHVSAAKDAWMGNKTDVRRFMEECRHSNGEVLVVGKKHGFRHDYNHITMLTKSHAVDDHFPYIINWMAAFEQ